MPRPAGLCFPLSWLPEWLCWLQAILCPHTSVRPTPPAERRVCWRVASRGVCSCVSNAVRRALWWEATWDPTRWPAAP